MDNADLYCISCGVEADFTLKCELPMCKNCYSITTQQFTKFKEERTKFFPEMDKIIDNLYLGNEDAANNKSFLDQSNISHILIAGSFLSKLGTPEYTYHQIEVDDSTKENLRNHFASCAKFIDEAIKDEKSVLVHCAAGVSRSASRQFRLFSKLANMFTPVNAPQSTLYENITLHNSKDAIQTQQIDDQPKSTIQQIDDQPKLTMVTKKMDYDTAFNFVKERRTKIMPNSAFVGQLQELAESVKNNSF